MPDNSEFGSTEIVNPTPPEYEKIVPAAYYGHFFEQYKLFVEKTHDYWDQFLGTNEFFLKVNGVGIAAFAWLVTSRVRVPWPVLVCLVIVALAMARAWHRVIEASRKINAARHEIIQEWELQLPATPYRCEYQKLYCEPARKYHPIQPAYLVLPKLAGAVYVGFALLIFFNVILYPPGK
jgi:hypothetical protein